MALKKGHKQVMLSLEEKDYKKLRILSALKNKPMATLAHEYVVDGLKKEKAKEITNS